MDTRDIFRQLTRGANFVKKREAVSKSSKENLSFDTVKIKTEEDIVNIEHDTKLNESIQSVEDSKLTILGPITATESGKRAKKRKASSKINDDQKKILLHQEMINQYRNQNQISVVGRHVAEPIKTFEELPIGLDLIKNLKECGYTKPTSIQKQAIPIMLQERQMLACAPTGSGKTAAFLVPIFHTLEKPQPHGFRALIVCPTRELAKQIQRECLRISEGRDFRVHIISKINKALTQYGPKSSKKFDILVTTPNRLCFLLSQSPPAITLENIEWVIVDEADKLFEEGTRGFREQLQQILDACTSKKRKVAMFSATHTPPVAKWCCHNMKGLIRVTVGQRNAATDLVDQELFFVGSESGKLLAFRDLIRKGLHPPVLVFVQSKERAQQLFSELVYDGINIDAIHADRTQSQRDDTVRNFREGKVWVLVCTELMARGIDFKGVNLVINYDFPSSAISYVHRVGRAGRAGRKGKAITFFTTEDSVNLRSIAQVMRLSGCPVPEYMLALKKRSKKDRKKLQISAPYRNDIRTTPKYEFNQEARRKGRMAVTRKTSKKPLTSVKVQGKQRMRKPQNKKVKKSENQNSTE